jgi:hypothetical protein
MRIRNFFMLALAAGVFMAMTNGASAKTRLLVNCFWPPQRPPPGQPLDSRLPRKR